MKTSAKSTLMFFLFLLVFSMSGKAWNIAEHVCHNYSCQVSVSSSDCYCTPSFDSSDSKGFHETQYFSGSDMELGFKPVSETYSYTNNLRLRRIIEAVTIYKDMMRKFCLLRENLLVSERSKSYGSDKNPHYASVSCEYYIFALRRILI